MRPSRGSCWNAKKFIFEVAAVGRSAEHVVHSPRSLGMNNSLVWAVLGVATVSACVGCATGNDGEYINLVTTTAAIAPETVSERSDDSMRGVAGEWTYLVNADPLTDVAVESLRVVAYDYEYPAKSGLNGPPLLDIACDWDGRFWTWVSFDDFIVPRQSQFNSRLLTDVAHRVDRGEVVETLAGVDEHGQSVVWTDHKTRQLIEDLLDKEELIFVVWDGDGRNRRTAYFPVANLRESQHKLSRCL